MYTFWSLAASPMLPRFDGCFESESESEALKRGERAARFGRCQYLYFCTSTASTFCAGKASKLSAWMLAALMLQLLLQLQLLLRLQLLQQLLHLLLLQLLLLLQELFVCVYMCVSMHVCIIRMYTCMHAYVCI